MQKVFLMALLSGASAAAQAQTVIKSGTVQLGGSINYFHQNFETTGSNHQETTNSNFSVGPALGYFVADNLAIGLSAGFSTERNRVNSYSYYNPSFTERKNNTFSVGPFAQYYHLLTEQFGFAGTLSALYTRTRYDYAGINANGSYGSVANGNGLYAALVPSLVFFPIPKLALGTSFGSLSYNYFVSKQLDGSVLDEESHSTGFGATFGLSQLSFSGTYYFGRQ